MQKIQDLLRSFGLSDTETSLYLTGLRLGTASVGELVRQTGIVRTTAYHAIETLQQKGLAAETKSEGKSLVTMSQPSALASLIARHQSELSQLEGELKMLLPVFPQPSNTSSASVIQYEGVEGVQAAIEEALWCRKKQWEIIAPSYNILSTLPEAYQQYFLEQRGKRGIVARSLWEKDPARRLLGDAEIAERNPRFLPKAMLGKFKNLIIIFDDSVLVVGSKKQPKAVRIISAEMSQTIRTLFDGLWETAEPYTR